MKIGVLKNQKRKLLVITLVLTLLIPVLSFAGRYKDCAGHSRVSCWWGDTKIKVLGIEVKEADGHSHPGLEACLSGQNK